MYCDTWKQVALHLGNENSPTWIVKLFGRVSASPSMNHPHHPGVSAGSFGRLWAKHQPLAAPLGHSVPAPYRQPQLQHQLESHWSPWLSNTAIFHPYEMNRYGSVGLILSLWAVTSEVGWGFTICTNGCKQITKGHMFLVRKLIQQTKI